MNKEKKILIKFLAIVIASLLLGFFMGYNSMAYEKSIADQLGYLLDGAVKISPVLMVAGIAIQAAATVYYYKGKSATALALADDSEEKYEKADSLLETAIVLTNLLTIYSFSVFGIMVSGFGRGFSTGEFVPVIAAIVLFIAFLITGTFLQNDIVKQIQKMNPEKKGNVMDAKFHKEWFDSCDEAEKAEIGRGAYASYRATSNAIIAAFLIAVFVSMMYPVGPLPAMLTGGIWAVQFISYTKATKNK